MHARRTQQRHGGATRFVAMAAAAATALALAGSASAASATSPATPAKVSVAPAAPPPAAASRPSTMAIRYLPARGTTGVRFAWRGEDGKEIVSSVHPHADLATARPPASPIERASVNIARRANAPVTGLVVGRGDDIRAFPGIQARGGFGLLPKGKFVTAFPDGRVVSTPASRVQVARYDAAEAHDERVARAAAAAAKATPAPPVVTTRVTSAEELQRFLGKHPVKR